MKATTAILLARPSASAERGRVLLVAATVAAAGGMLLAAARIARLGIGPASETDFEESWGFTLITIGLLTLPMLAFAVQALCVGSVARDRRMAALRLAGAAPRDVRQVAAAEAGCAALAGGLLAGWVYAALWVLLGALPPAEGRILPDPETLDIAVWAVVALVAGAGGAVVGWRVQERVVAQPLAVFRRARGQDPRRWTLVATVAGPPLVFGALVVVTSPTVTGTVEWMLAGAMVIGMVVSVLGIGQRLVRRRGRQLRRRDDAEDVLAGWRLAADPQISGRVAGVLIICGLTLGFELVSLPASLQWDLRVWQVDPSRVSSSEFPYLPAVGASVVAVVVAVLTLTVAAADQLLDARRALATLSAIGVDEAALDRVLRRQLSSVALPAIVIGVLGAAVLLAYFEATLYNYGSVGIRLASTAFYATVAALFAGVLAAEAARLATRLLRSRLRAVIDPGNLRAG